MFFGALLALGQAPFVAVFVWSVLRATGARPWRRGLAAAGVLIGWSLAGLFGWTLGSFVEVSLSEPVPLYSDLRVLVGSVRWLVLGTAEGLVLAVAVAMAPEAHRAHDRTVPGLRTRRSRAALFGLCVLFWVATSAVGGLLYEGWAARDLAARTDETNRAIGEALVGLGVAENVAHVLVPHGIFVPVLYGVPTGVVFLAVRAAALRRFVAAG